MPSTSALGVHCGAFLTTAQLERAQPLADRVARQLRDAADIQLAEHVLTMRCHGLAADVQSRGDLLSGVALGNQLHQLAFTRRERWVRCMLAGATGRSEEHTSELQSQS